MQYMLLIYTEPNGGPQPGTPEHDKYMGDYFAFTQETKDAGAFVAGDALQPVETATSVRVRDGKANHTDGPFAETKEILGGYYLLDCKDLDEANAWAAKIPSAVHGTIEVRPLIVWE